MKKKAAFTLLEVVIALSLAAVLIMSLFACYSNGACAHARAKEEKNILFSQERMHLRLSTLFNRIPPTSKQAPSTEKKNAEPFFTLSLAESKFPALFFECASEVEKDPSFCSTLEALLYVSKEKELSIVLWPEKTEVEGRKEVLLQQVSSLSFSFFDPKEKRWKSEWGKNSYLPLMIKMTAAQSGAPETFIYFLTP